MSPLLKQLPGDPSSSANGLFMAKILVIDDSKVALRYIGRMLRSQAHEAFTADSGEEALALLKREEVDLIITDIYMPPPDGLDVLRQARTWRVKIPFIAMSGRPAPLNLFVAARALGAQLTLQKPFSAEQFQAAVDKVLGATFRPGHIPN